MRTIAIQNPGAANRNDAPRRDARSIADGLRVHLDRIDVGPEENHDRIARHEAHGYENDERDPEHDRDHRQEPADDVADHCRLPAPATSSARAAPCIRSSGWDDR